MVPLSIKLKKKIKAGFYTTVVQNTFSVLYYGNLIIFRFKIFASDKLYIM